MFYLIFQKNHLCFKKIMPVIYKKIMLVIYMSRGRTSLIAG